MMLSFAAGCLEFLGIALIYPFIIMIINPETVFSNELYRRWIEFSGIGNPAVTALILGAFALLLFIFKNLYIFNTLILDRNKPFKNMFIRLWHIYYDGFSHLPKWGKILIAIVVAKLLVLFVVFKFLLMPNYLNTTYTTEQEKSNHVLNELITKP